MANAPGTPSDDDPSERRKFARVKAPIYCRPARRRLGRRKVVDMSVGGLRVYSDEPFAKGARMEIDLFPPDGEGDFVTCLTEVVWIREIPGGDPANYDIGLQYLDVPAEAKALLAKIVDNGEDAP
ncbi:MAG: PilZ domain-containing protein [Myxococcota bacterium]